ncbi:uncharacterized protein LOC114916890 [Cajanus cajan]|uniref:uncharacterized protein LOC114916890 n=1 Tax=Cajanus cajan TaxID=3821 RepID=UPI0010FB6316|nr:uncharacterized protein LOC114916890 [Cajanus cajan]
MELDIGDTRAYQTLDPWFQSDASTGYLQDAIIGRDTWCEEQSLPSCSKDQQVDQIPILSTAAQPLHDWGITHQKEFIPTNQSSSPQSGTHEALQHADCGFTPEKNFITTNQNQSSSPQGDTHEALKHKHVYRGSTHQKKFISTNQSSTPQSDIHKVVRHYPASGKRSKIAYPFEIVKSGGFEGETTLKDINNMISLTTRSAAKPPRPPRGKDSVTLPRKLAPVKSKKPATSLARIPTGGRGSITIIKTTD